MKIIKNVCYGGFHFSDEAYEKMIAYGIPLKEYIKQKRNPETGLYDKSKNKKNVIFKRGESEIDKIMKQFGDYWDNFDEKFKRTNETIIRVVEELGAEANNRFSRLEIVEIPDDIDWEIDDYDGIETIRRKGERW